MAGRGAGCKVQGAGCRVQAGSFTDRAEVQNTTEHRPRATSAVVVTTVACRS